MILEYEILPDYIKRSNATYGTENWKKIGNVNVKMKKQIGDKFLFLFTCFDKYEDGYIVILAEDEKFNGYAKYSYNVVQDVQYRGNSEYPSKYSNEYAGETTFEKIKSEEDFELLKNNRYYFLECKE